MNARKELIDVLGNAYDQIVCADIAYNALHTDTVRCILKQGYSDTELNEFLDKLNIDYDNGYGGQELYGTVWLTNGAWLSRGEYDGSEWWAWNRYPTIPDHLHEGAPDLQPEYEPEDEDYIN